MYEFYEKLLDIYIIIYFILNFHVSLDYSEVENILSKLIYNLRRKRM